jgi:hypothetical protein
MIELPATAIEAQHALVTSDQLNQAGFAAQDTKWLIRSGRLERVAPRVLRLVGGPRGKSQRLLAAVLDAGPGSALSHTSALAWWKVPGFTLDDLHVTHARDGVHRPRRLATHVHDKVLLPDHHVRVLDGVPVVTPSRALFDLAGMRGIHPLRVERAVDNAWNKRLVSGKTLDAMLRDLARRGRPGLTVMRKILSKRGPDYVPPASGLEARVEQILAKDGQPPLRRQVDTGDEDGWIGRVDFADAKAPFRLEVQSERFHSSLLDQQADAERIARLEAAGFVVTTVTDVDVWHRPQQVADVVRSGRQDARRCRS